MIKKNLKICSGTEWLMTLKLGMHHWWLRPFQACSNDDPWLILTFFLWQGQIWSFRLLHGKKVEQWIFSSPELCSGCAVVITFCLLSKMVLAALLLGAQH